MMPSHSISSGTLSPLSLSSASFVSLKGGQRGNCTLPLLLTLIDCPYSEVEGRDRLVKVDKQEKLVQLASELGQYKHHHFLHSVFIAFHLVFTGSILGNLDEHPISKL